MSEQTDGIDFAVAAYREDGRWVVDDIADRFLTDLDTLASGLRRFPGDGGAVGLVAVDEDFFLVVRVTGPRTRLLLSDVTAALEWELAAEAVELLGLPDPEDDDEPEPAGDVEVLSDLGLPAAELVDLLEDLVDDDDLYPDEVLSEVARRLGFGELFDDAVGLTTA
ncbi:tRNA adenosine deaminase-associated protein [Nocardioides perillae]|uniref:Putative tRNA adenosine deaminase-associated protein n=1 Tax=Nocardioides perillae TaxID=1119534 RepID=A0A7Y9UUY6_9ACTN|nr:putative tRNA adenosine deaminase-associated protein [Nocardioides perillae]